MEEEASSINNPQLSLKQQWHLIKTFKTSSSQTKELVYQARAFAFIGFVRAFATFGEYVTDIVYGIELFQIGHPLFGSAHFATLFTPLLLALLIDFLSSIVGYSCKTSKRCTRDRLLVYVALIPGLNILVMLWYAWQIFMTKMIRAKIVQDYSNAIRSDTVPNTNEETRDIISNIAIDYKKNHDDYSTYSREYFYSHCLRGFAGNVPQIILLLAFSFRRGFCSTTSVITVLTNLISFTFASTSAFYYLPRKHLESLPWILEIKNSLKLVPMFWFANLARLYVLVFLATYTRYWTSLLYLSICLVNLLLSLDELKKNPKYTLLFILFSPISPCIVTSQCKTASPVLLSLGIILNLAPYVIDTIGTNGTIDTIGGNNPPITVCHTALGNFTGDWVRCPAWYLNESGPIEKCEKIFQFGISNYNEKAAKIENYLTFCQHQEYWDYVKYVITAATTLISITYFPYLSDYFNQPDSFTGDYFPKQVFKKVTSLFSKNHEVMYLRDEHAYMRSLISHMYLGKIAPNFKQSENFANVDKKMKELSGLSMLQWSIRESYFHLARYIVVRYKAPVGKEEWHEACQKGWIEIVEMLMSQALPKVPYQDTMSKLFRAMRWIGGWKKGYPKGQPRSRDEFKLSLKTFCKRKELNTSWIENLFSVDNAALIEAIQDDMTNELGDFLKLVHEFLKDDFLESNFLRLEAPLKSDLNATPQVIYEIQCHGIDQEGEFNPRDVCRRLGFNGTLGLWAINDYDWSKEGEDPVSCCQRWQRPSFCFCFNRGRRSYDIEMARVQSRSSSEKMKS